MADTLKEYGQVCRSLKALVQRARDEEAKAGWRMRGDDWDVLISKLGDPTDRDFTVYLLGQFISGKTSAVNAMLGEEFLPGGILPNTAAIFELRYGEEKQIMIYPSREEGKAEPAPFCFTPSMEELARYGFFSIAPGDRGLMEQSGVFDRVVIRWPLERLKDGLVLIDTPGTNSLPASEYIQKNIRSADLIIYVMNSCCAFTREDKEFLQALNGAGMVNIITAFTRYDMVDPDAGGMGKEKFRRILTERAVKYSALGNGSVHFISSLQGLKAKTAGDQNLLTCSGYHEFERFLEKTLVRLCGAVKFRGYVEEVHRQLKYREKGSDIFQYPFLKELKLYADKKLLGMMNAREGLIEYAFQVLERAVSGVSRERSLEYGKKISGLKEKFQNPELHLAVIGNFNCGKSTFLNALLRRELLSTDHLPATAIPTYIRWDRDDGGGPVIMAEDLSGRRYELTGSDAKKFEEQTGCSLPEAEGALIDCITTDNRLIGTLRKVELSFPKLPQYQDFCLIDTPGVNPGQEKNRGHVLETQSILRRDADAAIVLFPATQVYTADFQAFLEENAAHLMADSIFIITQMDTCGKESERPKLIRFVKTLLEQTFSLRGAEVCGISAGRALRCYTEESAEQKDRDWADGFETVMEHVLCRLRERKQEILLNRITEMLQALAHVIQEELKKAKEVLEEDKYKLALYSFEHLQGAYQELLDQYLKKLSWKKKFWSAEAERIAAETVENTKKLIIWKINRKDSFKTLKEYISSGLDSDIAGVNTSAVGQIDSMIREDAGEMKEEFAQAVGACLEKYQCQVESIAVFSEQKRGRKIEREIVPKQAGTPSIWDSLTILHERPYALGAILLPLLISVNAISKTLLASRKEKVIQGLTQSMDAYVKELQPWCREHAEQLAEQNSVWAETLLERYQTQYRNYFTEKKEEYRRQKETLLAELAANQQNLYEIEIIEDALLSEIKSRRKV